MIEFVAIVLGMIVVILASCLVGERRMRADAQKSHEESERKRREEMLTAEGYRQMVKDISNEAIESAAHIDKLEAEKELCDETILSLAQDSESVKMSNKDLVEQVNRLSAELVAAQALLVRESERSNCFAMRFREKEVEALQANQLRGAAEERLNELLGKIDLLSNKRKELEEEIAALKQADDMGVREEEVRKFTDEVRAFAEEQLEYLKRIVDAVSAFRASGERNKAKAPAGNSTIYTRSK